MKKIKISPSILSADFSQLGKEIKRFLVTNFNPGKYNFSWNAKNSLGQEISTGVYLIKLQSASSKSLEKVIYLK